MAIFLDHQVQSLLEPSYKHDLIQWHPKDNLLAASYFKETVGGEVHLFLEEGEHSKESPLRKPGARASSMAWHPDKRILAIGWSNGDLTVWNEGENMEPFGINLAAMTELNNLVWSSNGFRLLITTASAEVFVYKIDHRGQPHSSPFSRNHLKEPIVAVVLKPPAVASALLAPEKFSIASDLDGADALDMFTVKRQPQSGHPLLTPSESATFFLGGSTGGIYCVRESGTVMECFTVDRPVLKLLYYVRQNILLTISEDLMMCQHMVSADCATDELIRVKLTGKPAKFEAIWASDGVLAMSSGENKIRLLDLAKEENCILSLNPANGYSATDTVICLAYSETTGMLAAGTNLGQIAMWKYWKEEDETELEDLWKLQSPIVFQSPIEKLFWADNRTMLAVATSKDLFTLLQHTMLSHFNEKMAAVQLNQTTLCLTKLDKLVTQELKPELRLKGAYVSDGAVAVWDGQQVFIYEVDERGNAVIIGNFQCSSITVCIFGQNVYVCEPARLQVRTYQGTVKQLLPLSEEEGSPQQMHILGETMVVGTSGGFIRAYDLSRREAKQKYHPKYVAEGIPNFGSVVSVRGNASGTKISYILRSNSGETLPKLFVWDAETDSIGYFSCVSGVTDQTEYDAKEAKLGGSGLSLDMSNSVPVTHCWDTKDGRLLACQAKGVVPHNQHHSYIVTFFMTSEHGLLIQDCFSKSSICENLLGVDMPYYYFTKQADQELDNIKLDMEKAITRQIIRRISREFMGLENSDEATKEAMLNFSFFMTVGNMDEAFKAIKSIKSESVWENMAQMCVKTQRLDVASVCLGNMGHARGARALRKVTRQEKEPEVRVAMLALQLGLSEDAAQLYNKCGRFDLMNKLNQTMNNWKQATDIAGSNDRIHLRNTYYAYAAHLESVGALEGAVENYEKSDTHRFEVPRMLFDSPSALEQYVRQNNKDPYLNKWWAQYLESLGEMESARAYYTSAKDYLSVVRICCYMGDLSEASAIANESGDEAACYHLARQYENEGQFQEAVHFFMKAGAYSSAIHLAKEHEMEDKIAHLSLMSSESDMIEAAKFYEDKPGQADKAVMLYHKAGMFGRALDLAFRTEQFSALDLIAGDLDENSDPRVLERCAEFFSQNQQYTKAVQLLGYAKQHKKAIELCSRKNVPISEQLVELLTPSKDVMPNAVERNRLLEELADCCMQQGHYHYAAKKYTQAGSTIQAMRALLKSGDTEKIVFFANTARSKEIYVMAGNYLQTTNWKSNPDLMKQIVTFYTKANAPELLAGFYDACAQVEIDDYRDYEKGLSALQEALKCTTKSEGKNAMQTQERADDISRKIALVRKFLNIKTIYQSDPAEAMKELQEMASDPNIDDAVRLGDIYAVLIIHNVKKNNFKKAHTYLEELKKKQPKVDLARFVKPQITDRIYNELNLPIPKLENGLTDDQDEDAVPESFSLKKHIDLNENNILNGHD